MHDDPLAIARGILHGVIFSCVVWISLALAWFYYFSR